MDPVALIDKYYPQGQQTRAILLAHSRQVADMAVSIAENLGLDASLQAFIHEAAMLHDIGIVKIHLPALECFGESPYVCHGYLGGRILEEEGLTKHALVCERHVGVGITKEEILANGWPMPARDMVPVSREEMIVSFADKFYSKNGPGRSRKKTVLEVLAEGEKYGAEKVAVFKNWMDLLDYTQNPL